MVFLWARVKKWRPARQKARFSKNNSCNWKMRLLLCISCPFSETQARRCFSMAKCQFCDKDVAFGIKVSHSHRRSNRTWKPNVKRVKAIVDGKPQHVYACTRCLRSGKVTRAV
jgi:large subunit ribosomal protein L28